MAEEQTGAATPREIDVERFFDLAVDVMVVASPDGRFERVNPALSQLLGLPMAQIVGMQWSEFVHPDDRDVAATENVRLFEESGYHTTGFVNRYIDVGGGIHWLEWSAEADPDTGLVYATARDVTERRAAEAALEHASEAADAALRAKSEFLSRMSHELRTPLNVILGFGQLLEQGDLDGEQRANLRQILQAGQHLLGLIDEVLEVTRIDAGSQVPSDDPVLFADPVVTGTVLYIEDNSDNARLVDRLLADRPGLDLVWAPLGHLGVEMARQMQPRLILLDLHLPDVEGEQVLSRLRDDPVTIDIPVVVLSADATRDRVAQLLSTGAADYLTKPFDLDHLLSVIDRHVGQ